MPRAPVTTRASSEAAKLFNGAPSPNHALEPERLDDLERRRHSPATVHRKASSFAPARRRQRLARKDDARRAHADLQAELERRQLHERSPGAEADRARRGVHASVLGRLGQTVAQSERELGAEAPRKARAKNHVEADRSVPIVALDRSARADTEAAAGFARRAFGRGQHAANRGGYLGRRRRRSRLTLAIERDLRPARAQELVSGDRRRQRAAVLGDRRQRHLASDPFARDRILKLDRHREVGAIAQAQADRCERCGLRAGASRANVDRFVLQAGAQICHHLRARPRAPAPSSELDRDPGGSLRSAARFARGLRAARSQQERQRQDPKELRRLNAARKPREPLHRGDLQDNSARNALGRAGSDRARRSQHTPEPSAPSRLREPSRHPSSRHGSAR